MRNHSRMIQESPTESFKDELGSSRVIQESYEESFDLRLGALYHHT